ncbi:MAG: hypothetical protein M3R00_07285 [Pseudomonadota bacterium]|nr:hypothetical protein [Pseudomonadota bacterium]
MKSSYAKVTAKDVTQQFMPPVTLDGAQWLFKNPAFSGLMQPILTMMHSQMLLEESIASWSNCNNLLLNAVTPRLGDAMDEAAAAMTRERLFKDKAELDAVSKEFMTLSAALRGVQTEMDKFTDTQLTPLYEDLTTLQDMVEELRTELADEDAKNLLDNDLPEKIFAALHNPNSDTEIARLTKNKDIDLNHLSPLKKAMIIAILSTNSEQANE